MATLAARIGLLAQAIRDKINLIMPRLLPSGAIAGQVLMKNSSTNYDVVWGNRTVTFSGTTDSNGLATLTFSPAFSAVPFVTGECYQASTANPLRYTAVQALDVTVSGCKIRTMRHASTGVLLLNTTVPGMEVFPSAPYMVRVTGL
ncbi:hypothetical protein HOU00_gp086 [Caulobacter phage CcrPW]|uniref:Uncharacterized protein n=1 Tax=Caulobacter phage CcrPW TaxID=2283271 RepID=A0A385EC94_9CAUD|nr:hypothetical protein HOU00_gp086 [Caulobacter phage CcrPW]AXQ68625.1 hypothetical protein CcrPW_gp086 [Caulobacter phage CcrPW]